MDIDIEKITQLAVATTVPQTAEPGADPFVVVPEGYQVHQLEQTLQQPNRIRAKLKVQDAASFISYVNKFKTQATMIFHTFGEWGASFVAVLDYHQPDGPSWASHMATYTCPLSKEWKLWMGAQGTKFSQEDFARFIESNQLDILDPPGAQMLEVATTLEATSSLQFASAVNLQNGTKKLMWNEDTTSRAGTGGTLEVPKKITLALKPFINSLGYRVESHLRHHVGGGKVMFSYELIRPHKVIEDASHTILEAIEEKTTITPLMAEF